MMTFLNSKEIGFFLFGPAKNSSSNCRKKERKRKEISPMTLSITDFYCMS